ncbi:MAG: hypothetical protein Q8K82_00950, partial [Gemmatimonadaceae bacterium]|nr:hypothetical protein [Gemmatimonadaceae bacterium]
QRSTTPVFTTRDLDRVISRYLKRAQTESAPTDAVNQAIGDALAAHDVDAVDEALRILAADEAARRKSRTPPSDDPSAQSAVKDKQEDGTEAGSEPS